VNPFKAASTVGVARAVPRRRKPGDLNVPLVCLPTSLVDEHKGEIVHLLDHARD